MSAEGLLVRHNVSGADAEVDFGEVWVDLAGQRVKCYLFAFRLTYSGPAVHRISRSCGEGPHAAGELSGHESHLPGGASEDAPCRR